MLLLVCTSMVLAESRPNSDATTQQSTSSFPPDLREDDVKLKMQKGNLVVVPIPLSNPTLDSGLILGGAYFYSQSEHQKRVQPASMTMVAGMQTSSDSTALVLAQQNYWDQDRWRFTGVLGYGDLKLELLGPDESGNGPGTDWQVRGSFAYARISREIARNWYLGPILRYVDIDQGLIFDSSPTQFNANNVIKSAGLGARVEYDSRDMPTNAYRGRLLQVEALFNDPAFGSDEDYQSYNLSYSSYHELSVPVVLAWQVAGCLKAGSIPLWDTCRVNLRGFPATDYLGKSSTIAQFEARWRMNERWGLVGFAGAGKINDSFSEFRDDDIIPSLGFGVRFKVLQAKRINMRLDYARSNSSEGVYLSVGEAF